MVQMRKFIVSEGKKFGVVNENQDSKGLLLSLKIKEGSSSGYFQVLQDA